MLQLKCKPLIIFFLLFIFFNLQYAQEQGYQRKSISYIDELMYMEGVNTLSHNREKEYLSKLHTNIKLERFDYNPIPESSLEKFRGKVRGRKVSSIELEQILRNTVVPEIIKFLDIKKEMRAKDLVTESQKNSFIVQKARETGITAEQLKRVMNSSYLYVPYIEQFSISRNYDDKSVQAKMQGGVIWYHIITRPEPKVEKIDRVTSSVSEYEEKESDDSWSKIERKAYESLPTLMAINLRTRTRELEPFKLKSQISEVRGRKIKFPLGRKEGLKLDQPYYVGEWRRTSKGEKEFYKDGFVRIDRVAAEKSNAPYMSTAWAIHKGDWSRGMVLKEHPRLGIDLSINPRIMPINIERGVFVGNNVSAIFSEYSGNVPALDFGMNFNIAELLNKNQTFLTLEATGAIVPAYSKVYYRHISQIDMGPFRFRAIRDEENHNAAGYYVNGGLGFMKKYYMGPFALHWNASIGAQVYSVSASYREDVTLRNISIGGNAELALEYALNIDTNIGIFYGYNLYPAIDAWQMKYDNDEVDIMNYAKFDKPQISSLGRTYGIYFHYSIPSLSFNPFGSAKTLSKFTRSTLSENFSNDSSDSKMEEILIRGTEEILESMMEE